MKKLILILNLAVTTGNARSQQLLNLGPIVQTTGKLLTLVDTTVSTVGPLVDTGLHIVGVNGLNVSSLLNKVTSGLNKDILSGLFQLNLNDILSNQKEISFNSSIYAIKAKLNPDLYIDTNYLRQNFARNSNIYYNLQLDNAFRFSGMKFGYKYAILNKRDRTVSRDFVNEVNEALAVYNDLFDAMNAKVYDLAGDNAQLTYLYSQQVKKAFKVPGYARDSLAPELRQMLEKRPKDLSRAIDEAYREVLSRYAQKPLIVSGVDFTTYTDRFVFSNINLYLDGVAGLTPKTKKFNVEFKGRINLGFMDDNVHDGRDLQRVVLSGDAGFNAVFRNARLLPSVELALTASDSLRLAGRYKSEAKNYYSINGTLRIWLTSTISIPLTVRYDPEHQDFFGVLNIAGNLDLLNNILGKSN